MKKHEIIGLFILMIISTIYSLSLPEAEVNKLQVILKLRSLLKVSIIRLLLLIKLQQLKRFLNS